MTARASYDGQGFLVHKSSGVIAAAQLEGAVICVTAGSTNELNLADWAAPTRWMSAPWCSRTMRTPGRPTSPAAATPIRWMPASWPASSPVWRGENVILPDIISKEPLTPAVRKGDPQWFDIVRWTFHALVLAEELGVTRSNVDSMLDSANPDVRRMLGVSGDHGPAMGLDKRWAYNAVKAVSNYGEIFRRHLGEDSALGLPRGLNALWNKGGLMYAPPMR
jgi:general L-amino acid transport system substrate-binding protein